MPKAKARLSGAPRTKDQVPAKRSPSKDRYPSVSSAIGPVPSLSESTVLTLQRLAGNEAVTQLIEAEQPARYEGPPARAAAGAPTLQRGGTPAAATGVANAHADALDLVHGFTDLATAAVSKHGKTLDTVRLGSHLSEQNRALLERLRHVLILAQEGPKSKRTAIAEWPSMAPKLEAAFNEAKRHGIDAEETDTAADNLAFLGENYIGAAHHGPSEVENPADYVDLMNGIRDLAAVLKAGDGSYTEWMNKKQRGDLDALQFGANLSHRHLELLVNLRHALILARLEGHALEARFAWQSIQGDLQHVFRRASEFVDVKVTGEGPGLQERLNTLGNQLIEGAVYTQAREAAKLKIDLAKPDAPFQREVLKEAAEGMEEANELAKKTTEMVGGNVIGTVLGSNPELGEAIIKLATSPGDILKNFEAFKKKGLFGKFATGADIAAKALELRNSLVRVSLEWLKRFGLKQAEVAAEAAAARGWKNLAGWAGGKLEVLEKVDKAATVITVVVSAVKVVDYIRDGKYSEAVSEAGVTALGLAAKAPLKAAFESGAGGIALTGGIVVVVWAEAEALHGAAAMKEWAEKTSIREAAWEFVDVCLHAQQLGADDFIADVKLRADPANKAEWPMIDKNLKSFSRYWLIDIERLSEQLKSDRTVRVGGQPALRDELGEKALDILNSPGTWSRSWETMAYQMGVLFAGANKMATYVVKHYPKGGKAAEKKD